MAGQKTVSDDVNGIVATELRRYVDRIERLEEEIKTLNKDKSEVYAESKGRGFDVKILKKVIALRRRDKDDLDEEEALLDVYMRALGMRPDFDSDGDSVQRAPVQAHAEAAE